MTLLLSMVPWLKRFAVPILIVLLVLVGYTAVNAHSTVKALEHELAATKQTLKACNDNVLAFETQLQQMAAQRRQNEVKVREVATRFQTRLKAVQVPIDNTLQAIQKRGQETAAEASKLWQE